MSRRPPILLALALAVAGAPDATRAAEGEHAARRARLAALLAEEFAAGTLEPGPLLVPGAPETDTVPFSQADHALYLTGIDEPGLCLALRVGADGRTVEEVLFLADGTPESDRWVGDRLRADRATAEATGFDRIEPASRFFEVAREWLEGADVIHFLDEPRLESGLAAARVRRWLAGIPGAPDLDLVPVERLVDRLRLHKSPVEQDLLRSAAALTARTLREVLPLVRPGVRERELRGAVEGRFLAFGADGPAFPSIVGSGPNTCVLHHVPGERRLEEGELCLLDVGARVRGYSADVTRTVPVSGTFSPRQRRAYEIVLAAQEAAIEAARPGVPLSGLHAAAGRVLREGLAELLDGPRDLSRGARRRYVPHGTSHWIGIAVHDVGRGALAPGCAFTIEPGLYLPEEGLGIRIEDDFLMREDGSVERISTGLPRAADEIERLVRGSPPAGADDHENDADDEGR
ncbi:MAG: aminopeptidase P N-terminal domain-containing protein [Planctomycetota bacterium JB042]